MHPRKRRSLSREFLLSGPFMKLPLKSRWLYCCLVLAADDEGFVQEKVLKYAPLKSDFLRGLSADETVKSTLDAEMFDVPNEVDYADYVEVDQTTGEVLSTPADTAAEVQS